MAYSPDLDVRELLNVEELEEELGTGPNGGLVMAMRLAYSSHFLWYFRFAHPPCDNQDTCGEPFLD